MTRAWPTQMWTDNRSIQDSISKLNSTIRASVMKFKSETIRWVQTILVGIRLKLFKGAICRTRIIKMRNQKQASKFRASTSKSRGRNPSLERKYSKKFSKKWLSRYSRPTIWSLSPCISTSRSTSSSPRSRRRFTEFNTRYSARISSETRRENST